MRKFIDSAKEINEAKDSTQSAIAIKTLFKDAKRKGAKGRTALTKHFSNCFFNDTHIPIRPGEEPNFDKITEEEVSRHKTKLKNNRATGPDGTSSEDLKKMDNLHISETLNQMINSRSEILTHGYVVPIPKPGKNPLESSSYRPITLLSVWRKLLSSIVLERINRHINKNMDRSQHAYTEGKSTSDVVLTHKFLLAGSLEYEFNPTIVGIDMSKAFDNVNRQKLIEILEEVIPNKGNLHIIKVLMSNTTLAVKKGKSIGNNFNTNIGVPQGDGLSPKFFTFYLDNALKKINPETDHLYANNTYLPSHIEYADDVDFILWPNDTNPDTLVNRVKSVFSEYNLVVNNEKTEIVRLSYKADVTRIKKLGSYLDDDTDINKRAALSNFALWKFKKVWKNPFIKIHKKIAIYNTYVRSIFTYNCSTWHSNKTIAKKIDSVHRKHLRTVLNIRYPKIISNSELYKTTDTDILSEIIKIRRKTHLGHVLRRETSAKDVLKFVTMCEYRKGSGSKPSSIFKTYREDFGTDDPWILEEKAFARTL